MATRGQFGNRLDTAAGRAKEARWMGTKQAEDQISGIANDVLRMFGMVGA